MIEQRNSSTNAESFWKAQPYSSRCVAIIRQMHFAMGSQKVSSIVYRKVNIISFRAKIKEVGGLPTRRY